MNLKTPLTEKDAKRLRVKDTVLLSGTIVTARDRAHKYLVEGGKPPYDLNVIYHCGPIVKGDKVVSAGPTTSMREEPYEAEVIRKSGTRAIIGKGGMGPNTQEALSRFGCVYLTAVGGAGALFADRIKRVREVHMLKEWGMPEAFWVFEVEDMPLIVTMDSKGGNLHEYVLKESETNMKKLLQI